MEYSIKQLSELAGVSARTLRYYDEIGLLKPSRTNQAGYRYYGEKEVDLLLQILFYRERGFGLDRISEIVYRPDFDKLEALYEHLAQLTREQARLSHLIRTVTKTIASEKGEIIMKDKEKFEVFKQELVKQNEEVYGKEIREKYGEAEVDKSNRKMLEMSPEAYERFQNLEKEILEKLEAAVTSGAEPDSDAGKEIALLHKEWIGLTWNTYTPEAHRGVAQMYVADERFTSYYDGHRKGCAQFLTAAINHWI